MFAFLFMAVAITLSGALAPGPITAATLAAGTRFRHAGAWIAVGHAAVELPVILLPAAGTGAIVQSDGVRAGIALGGGVVLILMGIQLLCSIRKMDQGAPVSASRHPFWTGVILTGANPYFLVWWATVGIALVSRAMDFSLAVLAVFALVHWLCDLGWLELLSFASFKGSALMSRRGQQIVFALCAVVLMGFGTQFLFSAVRWTGPFG